MEPQTTETNNQNNSEAHDYNVYLIIGLLAAVVIGILAFLPKKDAAEPAEEATDFESCVEAGYPVMESDPRQCRTTDGQTFTESLTVEEEVIVSTPAWGGVVTSPLVVEGKAKGSWFFEANLPVMLLDSNNKVLAHEGAMAVGNWMVPEHVDFTVTLEFETPETELGILLIQKDNPSGLPENDAAYAMPVRFK